jgi:hypothetical protein
MTRSVAMLLAAASLLLARPARAQVDPFEFEVYPYRTVGRGVVELESLNSYVPKGHTQEDAGLSSGEKASDLMYRTALEFTYGLTDKVEAAAYVNMAHPNGESFQYAGSKYRLRGSLFEQGDLPVDLGWYLELDWHKRPQFDGTELELEWKAIVEKDIGRLQILLNPIFEKALTGEEQSEGVEFGYATGVYYNLWRRFSPGVEFYGGIGPVGEIEPGTEQQHYVFPVFRGLLPGGIEYNFGAGFGLTRGSDQVVTKVNLEFERFIGALFK